MFGGVIENIDGCRIGFSRCGFVWFYTSFDVATEGMGRYDHVPKAAHEVVHLARELEGSF